MINGLKGRKSKPSGFLNIVAELSRVQVPFHLMRIAAAAEVWWNVGYVVMPEVATLRLQN